MQFVSIKFPRINMSFGNIKFARGHYETEDKKEIRFIKNHSDFGEHIFIDKDGILYPDPNQFVDRESGVLYTTDLRRVGENGWWNKKQKSKYWKNG